MARTGTSSVKITGVNRLVRNLQAAGVDVGDLKDVFADVARMGARTASHLAPRGESGRLAADIRGNRAKNKAVITAGRKSVPYAGPINYGWPKRNIKASMFMQRADRAVAPFALRRLNLGLDRVITKRGLS